MKRWSLIFFLFFNLLAVVAVSPTAWAQSEGLSNSLFDPQAAVKDSSQEDEMYNAATDAMDEGHYADAARTFDQVAKLHGRRADGALYFKAYSLGKAGNKPQALATIAEFKKSYPQSRWMRDVGALEVELQGTGVNPATVNSEEDKLLALNAIMMSDPDKALPYIDKLLHGPGSPKFKDRALFVLTQSGSDKAAQVLLSVAKDNKDPNLQMRAIRYLGMSGHGGSALKDIYTSSTDPSVKKAVFQGWLMSGDREDVLAVARQEKSPELRKEAIHYLGMMGGRNELREMYKSSPDPDTREAIVQGMMMNGDSQGLAEIANTEKDPKVLDKAIRTLGMVGGQDSSTALMNIYNSHSDLETRKSVINALFLHNAAKEMVAMARKETNPELKKALTQKLSMMHSPEITDYMMEILNK
ncbi:MAG TPA: HEAT repeat domain-containing protein [Candidatus Angelobacter sp.]|nr:HEAT repeat domain-containing protein [Candidatus Angelobacter sp.]